MNRKPRILLTILTCSTLLLSSCFTSKMTVLVEKDGSGTIALEFNMNKEQMIEFGKVSGDLPSDDELKSSTMFYEKDLVVLAESFGEGVTFESFSLLPDEDDSIGYNAVYKFTDISKVRIKNFLTIPDLDAGDIKNQGITFASSQTAEGRVVKIFPQLFQKDAPQTGMQENIEEQINQLHPMLAPFTRNMNISVRVEFAEPVIETNASFPGDHSITLLELNLDDEEISVQDLTTILLFMDKSTIISPDDVTSAGMNLETKDKLTVVY